jgi:hypothetical protein
VVLGGDVSSSAAYGRSRCNGKVRCPHGARVCRARARPAPTAPSEEQDLAALRLTAWTYLPRPSGRPHPYPRPGSRRRSHSSGAGGCSPARERTRPPPPTRLEQNALFPRAQLTCPAGRGFLGLRSPELPGVGRSRLPSTPLNGLGSSFIRCVISSCAGDVKPEADSGHGTSGTTRPHAFWD